MTRARVLLTGATGYVGGRLLTALVRRGEHVRCLARDPARLSQHVPPGVELFQGDVTDRTTLTKAFADIDVAYYLVHSMGEASGFEDREKMGARNFADAAAEAGVKRIILSTYQSASGAGAAAMAELEDQVGEIAAGKPVTKKVFPHQIAFNVFSHNTKVAENGYNEEENKVIEEMRKMFHVPDLAVVPTCIRVPVLRAHSEAVTLDLAKPLSPAEAREILVEAPGIRIVDDPAANHFPMPLEASGDLDVHVGRIRKDLSSPNGLMMWVAGDQLLKGAAWNAVQIAEELAKLSARAQAAE